MPTFFVPASEIKKGTFTLTGKEAHHLTRVLRVTAGEHLTLSDNSGALYEAQILSLSRDVTLQVLQKLPPVPPPYPIHLFLSLLKSEKMELIVQKGVELNIESIHFIKTVRSVREEISSSKWERLNRIAQEAQKQCGRSYPLKLVRGGNGEDLIRQQKETGEIHFFLMERGERNSLRTLFTQHSLKPPYGLWIGPEGGWTDQEINLAQESGFKGVSLGPLILRSETAALYAVSSVLALAF